MLTHFLDLLAAVISVTSLLIVTYGALIGIISFLKNEIRRFTGQRIFLVGKLSFKRIA